MRFFCQKVSVANTSILSAILETSPSAIIIIDSDSLIVEWSMKAERMFGYRREEVLGRSLCDTIIPSQHKQGHMDGVKRYMRTRQSHLMQKDSGVILTASTKTGRMIPISLLLNESISDKGQILFIGFIQDISEKRRMEVEYELMDRSYRTLRKFLSNVPGAVAVFDLESWECTFYNGVYESIFSQGADVVSVLDMKEVMSSATDEDHVFQRKFVFHDTTYEVQIIKVALDDKYFCMLHMADITASQKLEKARADIAIREQMSYEQASRQGDIVEQVVRSIEPAIKEALDLCSDTVHMDSLSEATSTITRLARHLRTIRRHISNITWL